MAAQLKKGAKNTPQQNISWFPLPWAGRMQYNQDVTYIGWLHNNDLQFLVCA